MTRILCGQTKINWQARDGPMADRGAYLEIDAPTHIWSTDKEIVIVPALSNRDEGLGDPRSSSVTPTGHQNPLDH